jgi:barstar (barnase inhibitor)
MIVRIDTTRIRDWESFHTVFKEAMGFPEFYGANMDAWIDCMSDVDDAAAGMAAQHVSPGTVLTLQIDGIDEFASRCPEQYEGLVECAGIVNWRRVERGEPAVLALSFHKTPSSASANNRLLQVHSLMTSVFILWHTHEFDDGHEDVKLIGLYSTHERAVEALNRVKDQPGFCDCPEGFEIIERTVDGRDDWPEGYTTVESE